MNWLDEPQGYAIVAVLESDDEDLKLYTIIKERIEQSITTRIKI